ncbi:MAG: TAXI family TRAP transporter solute-binding subunit [Desulfomonile tiedjei]|nr:TAXI family TRAP transporter solute-binding subunit [Desulfomonile tiedjei]
MKFSKPILAITLTALLVFGGLAILAGELSAQGRSFGSRGSFSSSRSMGFTRSAPWSATTHNTWNRSGGGYFGKGDAPAQGYSKPSLQTPSSSSGYSKPTPQQPSPGSATKPSGTNSSGGYSKPSLQGPSTGSTTRVGEPKASGGYAKPTGPAAAKETFAGGSKFDKTTLNQEKKKRAQESLEAYKADQGKFRKPEEKFDRSAYESNPLYQNTKVYSGFDYKTYAGSRDGFFRNQAYQPPAFAFGGPSSFGLFNTMFLFWMLDHMRDKNVAATAYNHQDDPGFQKWRKEVEELAKNDTDLKTKLAEMDKQIKSMQGTPKDPSYLPPGVPPEAVLSAAALASKQPEKPVVRVATGSKGGWYEKVGELLRKTAESITVQLVPSEGSLENIKLLVGDKADIAVVQSDVLAMMGKDSAGKKLLSEQTTLYPEFVQLIANRDSGIETLKDLDPRRHVIYIGPKGSGTSLTWQGLCDANRRYQKIPTRNGDYSSALTEVETNPKAVMMFVGGLNSEFLKKAEADAERSGKLRLVPFDDRSLLSKVDQHGNKIYTLATIPSGVYKALQKGWFFGSDVETLAIKAVAVLRTEWAKKYGPEAMDALSAAVLQTKSELQSAVNAPGMKLGSTQRAEESLLARAAALEARP